MAKKPKKETSEQGALTSDLFRHAAEMIVELIRKDRETARNLWSALRESAQTDTSGAEEPELLDAAKIAAAINFPISGLVDLKIFLTIKAAWEYSQTRLDLKLALPKSLQSFQRQFKKLCDAKLGRVPHDYGTDDRSRYALTYSELLHIAGVPGIDLVEELPPAVSRRLDAIGES